MSYNDLAHLQEQSFLERLQTRPRVKWLLDTFLESIKISDLENGLVKHKDLIDVNDYAERRQIAPDWVTVEIGPGSSPSGLNRSFSGNSRYYGLENYSFEEYATRSQAEKRFKTIASKRPGENIELKNQHSFGRQIGHSALVGSRYDLPDGIANEIFICRVYDKPGLAEKNNDEQIMTKEAARLLAPDGMILIADYARNTQKIASCLAAARLKLRLVSRFRSNPWEAKVVNDSHIPTLEKLGVSVKSDTVPDMLLVASS